MRHACRKSGLFKPVVKPEAPAPPSRRASIDRLTVDRIENRADSPSPEKWSLRRPNFHGRCRNHRPVSATGPVPDSPDSGHPLRSATKRPASPHIAPRLRRGNGIPLRPPPPRPSARPTVQPLPSLRHADDAAPTHARASPHWPPARLRKRYVDAET